MKFRRQIRNKYQDKRTFNRGKKVNPKNKPKNSVIPMRGGIRW